VAPETAGGESLFCGVDIGASATKLVLLDARGEVCARALQRSGVDYAATAEACLQEALALAGGEPGQVRRTVSTGYGRRNVPFSDQALTELHCHGIGCYHSYHQALTVIDIGGQDSKVIWLDRGRVREFAMNDRCAAGTGRFFEAMARVLQCGLEGISSLENQGERAATISSQCSVFAESEVVTLINEGTNLPDIIAGINNAVANRLFSMVRRVGLAKELVLTGGCSKNAGLAKALQNKLGVEVTKLPEDPQIAGAVGAALIALEKAAQKAAVA